jgi:hypothetical protein
MGLIYEAGQRETRAIHYSICLSSVLEVCENKSVLISAPAAESSISLLPFADCNPYRKKRDSLSSQKLDARGSTFDFSMRWLKRGLINWLLVFARAATSKRVKVAKALPAYTTLSRIKPA